MPNVYYGFSVISALVYVVLSALIIGLLIKSSIVLYPRLIARGVRTTEYFKLSAALDSISRDLMHAPGNLVQWQTFNEYELKWKGVNKTICWRFKKNKLYRMEGSFLKEKKKWISKTKSLAADCLDDCNFRCVYSSDHMKTLTITLTSTKTGSSIIHEKTVMVRQGEYA